jgi:catechol 2,3-dioxygenase-like lactoylglutathione lyase family enzyme
MDADPKLYWGAVLETPDARRLAEFYAALLGWRVADSEPDWATVAPPEGVAYLGFQTSPEYQPPTWPAVEGKQQMMLHLDFEVRDLDTGVRHALDLGATLADFQPQEKVRVLLDPVGHPFCMYVDS